VFFENQDGYVGNGKYCYREMIEMYQGPNLNHKRHYQFLDLFFRFFCDINILRKTDGMLNFYKIKLDCVNLCQSYTDPKYSNFIGDNAICKILYQIENLTALYYTPKPPHLSLAITYLLAR
jgi:hypothetical protein